MKKDLDAAQDFTLLARIKLLTEFYVIKKQIVNKSRSSKLRPT